MLGFQISMNAEIWLKGTTVVKPEHLDSGPLLTLIYSAEVSLSKNPDCNPTPGLLFVNLKKGHEGNKDIVWHHYIMTNRIFK